MKQNKKKEINKKDLKKEKRKEYQNKKIEEKKRKKENIIKELERIINIERINIRKRIRER